MSEKVRQLLTKKRGLGLFWSALTCQRFGQRRLDAAFVDDAQPNLRQVAED